MMQHRRLGRTDLQVSVVGFGTAQFRLVPEQRAIDALKHGFSLGVNLVHTAPDYEGADDLVAQAVAESGKDIIVCHQGHGDRAHIEWLFETACKKFNKERLELFGIACVDDRELVGENVWGPGGHIEFLQQKKREGRVKGIFCTTHGSPSYIRRLVESDAFDAIMMAYNPLGFHLLSYNQSLREKDSLMEFVPGNADVIPSAARRDIGLMLMKPLAGGLLCEGKAFPPLGSLAPGVAPLRAAEILRFILLNHPEVSCVMPGTASVAEAEENARAGYSPLTLPHGRREVILLAMEQLRSCLCSRCGRCDDLCSKKLPVSWLFRDYYITINQCMQFETLDRLEYHVLHPWAEAACAGCADVTCRCPFGINIPLALVHIHKEMETFREMGLLPVSADEDRSGKDDALRPFAARLFRKEVPAALDRGQAHLFRLVAENVGADFWRPSPHSEGICLLVFMQSELVHKVRLRGETPPGEKAHFVFELRSPSKSGFYRLHFVLLDESFQSKETRADLLTLEVQVR
ncbi:MAG: aldo/keto reductase [Syntrophobacteraceae bacterium]|jgi:predicted aldo/keto reductase-like oxidoreductase